MSRNVRKPTMWILTRSDTNQAVQLLEMARDVKFCIKEVEVLYPSGKNKSPDLCLYFCICKMLVFLRCSSNNDMHYFVILNFEIKKFPQLNK